MRTRDAGKARETTRTDVETGAEARVDWRRADEKREKLGGATAWGDDVLDAGDPIVYGTVVDSIVDGPGLRLAVFLQGCPHSCPGCHNPESQTFSGGEIVSAEDVVAKATPLTRGITISGGEPFAQPKATLAIVSAAREAGIESVWIWSGWTYEALMSEGNESRDANERILAGCDVLVDGPFIADLHDASLKWRGSSNQRIIDLEATRKAGRVVEIEDDDV